MHKIDSDGATVDNKFTEGDPLVPVQATIVSAAWLNAVQGEIVSVIEDVGLSLLTSGTDTENQLLAAIKLLITNGGDEVEQAIANNTGPADIGAAGELEYDPSTVAAVFMKYYCFRRTDSGHVAETGYLHLLYDEEDAAWEAPEWQSNFGSAGVTFTMGSVSGGANDGFGKPQYTSDDLAGASYSGKLIITDVKVIYQ